MRSPIYFLPSPRLASGSPCPHVSYPALPYNGVQHMNQTRAKVELTIVVGLPCSWRFTSYIGLSRQLFA